MQTNSNSCSWSNFALHQCNLQHLHCQQLLVVVLEPLASVISTLIGKDSGQNQAGTCGGIM
jgi:hypothetical protein